LRDEGIGIQLLGRLEERAAEFPNVEFYDLGTGGMSLIHYIADKEKAIIIDCAFMKEAQGSIRRFLPTEVKSGKQLSGFSLHEGDILKVLDISEKLGQLPKEVVIFGIEPADISPGEELSPVLAGRLEEYEWEIIKELSNT